MRPISIDPGIIRHFLKHRIDEQREYFLHPPYIIETRLLKAVSAGNFETAYELLEKINQLERAMLSEEPVRSLKNSLICSCTLLTRAVIEGGVPPEVAFNFSDANILEIEKIDNRKELLAFEYTMLQGFVRKLRDVLSQLHSYSHPVQMTVEYIHEKVLQDFSIHDLAEHVYLNPNYLSHLFKKEVGCSLTEFINRERVEESIYFLVHTNSSVSEIALLFHFCNQSYYSSLFRKYCGVTPTEYREHRGGKAKISRTHQQSIEKEVWI